MNFEKYGGLISLYKKHGGPDNIYEADQLIFPCNIGQQHWIVIVVFPKERVFKAYDSLSKGACEVTKNRMLMILNFILSFERHQTRRKPEPLSDEKKWKLNTIIDNHQQKNNYDCGLYTLLFALGVHFGWNTNIICQNKILSVRRHLAVSLLEMFPVPAFKATNTLRHQLQFLPGYENGKIDDQTLKFVGIHSTKEVPTNIDNPYKKPDKPKLRKHLPTQDSNKKSKDGIEEIVDPSLKQGRKKVVISAEKMLQAEKILKLQTNEYKTDPKYIQFKQKVMRDARLEKLSCRYSKEEYKKYVEKKALDMFNKYQDELDEKRKDDANHAAERRIMLDERKIKKKKKVKSIILTANMLIPAAPTLVNWKENISLA